MIYMLHFPAEIPWFHLQFHIVLSGAAVLHIVRTAAAAIHTG